MSVKRVFAIIGIVLGCVTAFVGGVLGVMAAMGKFKTPVVKPEKIYFEKPEQVIVAQYIDDEGKDVIYSFVLVGENDSIDYEVNVKDCFVWFDKNIGEDLIQLCDKDGNPLQPDAKKRYKIQCNENVYYKLKEVDENVALDPLSELNGKVVLKARTADELHNAEKDLTIWIDRNITSIFLDYGDEPVPTNEKIQEQRINFGVDYEVEFNYVVNPEISWQPISKESKKIVELYYDDPKTEDFVLVNVENIKNKIDYSLYKIFDETKCLMDPITGELKLVFVSNTITNGTAHEFKLAIFPSYNARAEFLANESNLSLTNVKRLESMVVTNLYIEVVNTEIDNVTMSDGVLNLLLYTENDSIYLRNDSVGKNNLNIEMQNDGEKLDIRLDEVEFNAMSNRILNNSPKFVIKQEQAGILNEFDFKDYDVVNYNDTTLRLQHKETRNYLDFNISSTIKIGNYKVINELSSTTEDYVYYCKNGVALIYDGADPSTETIKLLNVGSYLDFYVLNTESKTYTLATDTDIKYSIETQGEGVDKLWNIKIEFVRELEEYETFVLGLIVANNDGKFVAENMFATKNVTINEQPLEYEVLNSQAVLDIIATSTGYQFGEDKEFSHFINVINGTCNAVVLVISEDEIANALVNYTNITFTKDSKTYYVVGNIVDNEFTNIVRAKNNAAITKTTSNNLKLLQLANGFNSTENRQETASEFINRLIQTNGVEFSINNNAKELINETITIKQNLKVDESVVFNAEVDDLATKPTELYSGTNDHKIEITANNDTLISRINTFYGINVSSVGSSANDEDVYILDNYINNAYIKAVNFDDEMLTFAFDVGEMLNGNVNVEIGLANIFKDEVSRILYSFKIKSSAPESIAYYYNDGGDKKSLTLTEEQEDAPIVTAKIAWDSGYVVEWFVDEVSLGNTFALNTSFSFDSLGFQDPNFKVAHKITYSISGNSIEIVGTDDKTLQVVGSNDAYLSVTAMGETRYLKIEVVAENFSLQQVDDTIYGDEGNLTNIISYTYDADGSGSEDPTSIYSADIVSLANFVVQYSENLICDTSIENVYSFKTSAGIEIFKIEKKQVDGENDWVFTRVEDKYAALSIWFDVITKTNTLQNIKINFEKDVTHELNAMSWGTIPTLYAGTTIQVYEEVDANQSGEYVFTTEPLIKIRNKGGNTIVVKKKTGADSYDATKQGETLTLTEGKLEFGIFINDVWIVDYPFDVVPNIVVKQKEDKNLVLNSGSNNVDIFNNVGLYQYITEFSDGEPITYGATKDKKDNIILYSTDFAVVDAGLGTEELILVENTSELKNSITMQSAEKTESDEYYVESYVENVGGTDTTKKIKTGWIDLIGKEVEVVVTIKSGATAVGTFNAIVKNSRKIKTKSGISIDDDDVLNIKAMTDINDWLVIDGFKISEIKWSYSTADENKTFEITTGNKYEIPALNVKYENVILTLIFEGTGANVGKTLIFEGKNVNDNAELTINIVPFELAESASGKLALSEKEFNLLTDIYNNSDIQTYYKCIKVLSVKDKNGNSLTSSNLGVAYNNENTTAGLEITFNKISGDKVSAFITYEVKYIGGLVYTYEKEIELQNWQALSVTTPEQSEELSYDEINLVNYVSGNEETHKDVKFEPILVNSERTINLLQDNDKFVNRIQAKDRSVAASEFATLAKEQVESVAILAYQNSWGLSPYTASIVIDVENATLTFPKTTDISGIIAIRLTTKSGNYADYYFYVTSLDNNAVSAGKTADINSNVAQSIAAYITDQELKDTFKIEDKSNVKFFLLNATTLVDNNPNYNTEFVADVFGASVNQYSCVNDKHPNISKFTTITLSLIYNDGYNIYPIGILKLYLRPTDAVTTSTLGKDYSSSYDNGEFTYIIEDANATSVPAINGFTNTPPIQTGNIVTDTLGLSNRVLDDYKFTVFYKHTTYNYIIKVDYTYKAVSIKTAIEDKYDIVGEFKPGVYDEGLGKELSSFDNTVVIDSTYYAAHFGTYKGQIKIGGATFNVGAGYSITGDNGQIITNVESYTLNSGVLTLTFTQGLYDEEKQIEVVYNNLRDESLKTQTYTFNVLRGVEIKTNANDGGIVSGQRKTTDIKTTDTYTQNIGSQLTIYQTPTDDGVKYTFAGYTIYVKGAGELEFDVGSNSQYTLMFNRVIYDESIWNNVKARLYKYDSEKEKYVPNTDLTYSSSTRYYEKTNVQTVSNSSNNVLNFVHLAQNVNLDLTFTISDGTDTFKLNENDLDVRNLYLTLPKTYLGVEAVYTTTEADVDGVKYTPTAENIVKGTTIADFVKYLFNISATGNVVYPTGVVAPSVDSTLKNEIKLKLKYYDKTDKKEKYIETDFSAMGFVNSENPNFLRFTIEDGGKINYVNNNAGIKLPDNISANEICKLYLSNNAGMSTFEYGIQIMAGSKIDGINFSDAGFVDEATTYMSFVINKDDDTSQAYNTGRLKIGSIIDKESKGVWVKKGTGNTINDWKFLPKTGTEDQRTAEDLTIGIDDTTDEKYDIILETDPYDNTIYNIYMIYYRIQGSDCLGGTSTIQPIIHGTSGYILDGNFKIVLINADISGNDSRETGIYGGVKIDLEDKLSISGATVSINYGKSTYKILDNANSETEKFNEEGSDLVVEADEGMPFIQTKTVGNKVEIDLVLDVKIGDYFVKSITYQFQLDRSVQFFFNAEKDPTSWVPEEVYEYRTNFVITNPDDNDADTNFENFELSFSFGNTYLTNDKKTIGSVNYFSSLNWMIKDKCLTEIESGVDVSKNPKMPNPDDDTFVVDNTGITFKKDYNGDINLLLEVLFTNGTSYSVNWKITVFGILKIDNSIKTNDGNLSNGAGYNSGTKVNLINSSSGESTGLHMQDMTNYLTNSDNVDYNNITTTINYAIVKYNSTDGLTNAERFGSAEDSDIKSATEIIDSNNTSGGLADKKYYVQLPVVPSVLPGSTERYLVIYKVEISYLGKTLDPYYVAYKTVNFLNISVVNETIDPDDDASTDNNVKLSGGNINVNTRLASAGTSAVTTYLDVFAYTETYRNGTDTYKIWLDDITSGQPKYKAKKNSETEAKNIEITNSSETEKLTFTYGGSSITATRDSIETYYKLVDGTNIPIYSMFKLSFNNIAEFGNFVSTIGYIEINNYKFELTRIADGRWGINLAEKYAKKADGTFETTKDTSNMLFSNKLQNSDFVIVSTEGQPIYTLKSYNDLPENGFRMHTDTLLTAKGSKKISELFVAENVTGYTTIQNYEVVGVYGGTETGAISAPQANWVTNAEDVNIDDIKNVSGVTIKVPTGVGTNTITYTLQEVEYSGSGGVADVCDVKEKFYVLHCADHAAVYRMNANTTNMIKYNQGQDTIVDLDKIFVKFANNETAGKLEIVDASVTAMTDESKNVHTGLTDYMLTITDNKITMAESDLIAYKNANPTATYVTVYYQAAFDGKTLKCGLTYQLPSLPSVHIEQSDLATSAKIGLGTLCVPDYTSGTLRYTLLSEIIEENDFEITSISEKSTSYTVTNGFDKENGKITLNKNLVDAYFTNNTDAKVLQISYTITTKTNNTTDSLNFVIVVKKA